MPIGASLHIGLNAVDPKQYSGWDGQLTACEFDANDMQALAKTQGFTKVTKRLTKGRPAVGSWPTLKPQRRN